jgi:hypothetical protein
MIPMLSVARIAFGVSFGLLAVATVAVIAAARQRNKRHALLAPGRSPKQAAPGNIRALASLEHQNHIKRPPFLPQPGGSSVRD